MGGRHLASRRRQMLGRLQHLVRFAERGPRRFAADPEQAGLQVGVHVGDLGAQAPMLVVGAGHPGEQASHPAPLGRRRPFQALHPSLRRSALLQDLGRLRHRLCQVGWHRPVVRVAGEQQATTPVAHDRKLVQTLDQPLRLQSRRDLQDPADSVPPPEAVVTHRGEPGGAIHHHSPSGEKRVWAGAAAAAAAAPTWGSGPAVSRPGAGWRSRSRSLLCHLVLLRRPARLRFGSLDLALPFSAARVPGLQRVGHGDPRIAELIALIVFVIEPATPQGLLVRRVEIVSRCLEQRPRCGSSPPA